MLFEAGNKLLTPSCLPVLDLDLLHGTRFQIPVKFLRLAPLSVGIVIMVLAGFELANHRIGLGRI